MSKHIDEKSDRLLAEGKVEPYVYPAQVFEVDGDGGRYLVTITAASCMCTCKAELSCSHIEAARKWVLAAGKAEQFTTYQEALKRRKAADEIEANRAFDRL